MTFQLDPTRIVREASDYQQKLATGLERLGRVDRDEVRLGETPKREVYRQDKLRLYRFEPRVETPAGVPILIVYSLVSRHTMTDLQPDRSMVRNLLDQGLDVYLIDWGYPTRADRWLTIADHVDGYIDDCVEVIAERHRLERIDLLGICQGGVMTLCYAALHPSRVRNLVLTLTPVDFHADFDEDNKDFGFVNLWQRHVDVDLIIDAFGNVPGDFMAFAFSMTKPLANLAKYGTSLVDALEDESKLAYFLRMEKWISDNPDMPAETARQWMKELYQENRLVKGTFELDGRRVSLADVTAPILNVYAQHDHLVPPRTTSALADHVGTDDYTELSFPGGHIGVYVGGRSQKTFAPAVADWLRARG